MPMHTSNSSLTVVNYPHLYRWSFIKNLEWRAHTPSTHYPPNGSLIRYSEACTFAITQTIYHHIFSNLFPPCKRYYF